MSAEREVLERILEKLALLQAELAAHQADEAKHHDTMNGTLKLLIEDKREQAHRLTALEQRVARLEDR